MSKRKNILLLAAIELVVAVALGRFALREKTYEGKTLAEWTKKVGPYRRYKAPYPYSSERTAISALCTNDFPALVQALDYDYVLRRQKLRARFGWLPRPILTSLLTDRKARRVEIALDAFWVLGTNAAPAIPMLTRLMYSTDNIVAINAVNALSSLSTNSLPALLHAATDPACPGRFVALLEVMDLKPLDPTANGAVPMLIASTHDTNKDTVVLSLLALGHLATEPELSLPAIHEAMQHPNEDVRREATNALANFEAAATTNRAAH